MRLRKRDVVAIVICILLALLFFALAALHAAGFQIAAIPLAIGAALSAAVVMWR